MRMSWVQFIIILGVIASIVLGVAYYLRGTGGSVEQVSAERGKLGYVLYVFGTDRCPHCRSLHEFLDSNGYGYVYCELDYGNCTQLFREWLELTGFRPAIPQTLVVVDGSLSAVVIGEVTDRGFWDSLILGSYNGKVAVYMGRSKVGEVPGEELQGFISRIMEKLGRPEG